MFKKWASRTYQPKGNWLRDTMNALKHYDRRSTNVMSRHSFHRDQTCCDDDATVQRGHDSVLCFKNPGYENNWKTNRSEHSEFQASVSRSSVGDYDKPNPLAIPDAASERSYIKRAPRTPTNQNYRCASPDGSYIRRAPRTPTNQNDRCAIPDGSYIRRAPRTPTNQNGMITSSQQTTSSRSRSLNSGYVDNVYTALHIDDNPHRDRQESSYYSFPQQESSYDEDAS